MRKTIIADGKEIVLQTNGLVPLLYKKELKRDFFADVMSMQSRRIDAEVIYNLIWIFAKTANEDIPDLAEWVKGFEIFPVLDYLTDITEMATVCITTKKSGNAKQSKKKTNS